MHYSNQQMHDMPFKLVRSLEQFVFLGNKTVYAVRGDVNCSALLRNEGETVYSTIIPNWKLKPFNWNKKHRRANLP